MDDLTQLSVACLFDVATQEEIDSWIQASSCADDVDREIFEIYSGDVGISRARLVAYFRKQRPDFTIVSDEGVSACKAILATQIERLHAGQITPYSFCRFICTLETDYMDNAPEIDGRIPYPDFIGDLWNACDWCDESWTLDDSGYLETESKRVAETLTKA